jgi:predicted O-linked N-acetylglucosamine transferase (SPINDLY family)
MDTTPGPPKQITHQAAGIPEDKFVFCSFNNRYKLNPPLIDLWANILNQCPDAILWISGAALVADDNLRREFELRGVAAERIFIAPRVATINEHRERIGAADLALDTMPYNSHSSGLDTLWAGVPMITMLGGTFAGRVGASLLHSVRMPELVTDSTTAYCDLAIKLYRDRELLTVYRNRLAEARTTAPLWNTEALTRSIEKIIEAAWAQHIAGTLEPIVLANPAH